MTFELVLVLTLGIFLVVLSFLQKGDQGKLAMGAFGGLVTGMALALLLSHFTHQFKNTPYRLTTSDTLSVVPLGQDDGYAVYRSGDSLIVKTFTDEINVPAHVHD